METKGKLALDAEQFEATQVVETVESNTESTPSQEMETEVEPVESAQISAQQEVENQEVEAPEEQSAEKPSEVVDYSELSQEELIVSLGNLLQEKPIEQIKSAVEQIKSTFYKNYNAKQEALKAEFLAQNPDSEYVVVGDAQESKIKEFLGQYRTKRDHFMVVNEQEKQANYQAKLKIIEQLKELTNSCETMHNTFHTFRELQKAWKEIGVVPQSNVRDLWDTYNHHTENFYNYIKINKELRDLDLKKNLEAKTALCEEAESLLVLPSAVNAFHKLQKLHTQWRETGPVSSEFKEQLWDRFKQASTFVNKRHQEFFDQVKEEQLTNLKLKEELCVKIEALTLENHKNRASWEKASEQIIEIQKVWKTIGFAPKKDNNKIYERFRAACNEFFNAKRSYQDKAKREQADNYQLKLDLCIQAEAHSENVADWKVATDEILALQKQWKTIGAVPHKHSDTVWKRFRSACDKFFDAKAKHFEESDSQFTKNLEAKRTIIEELKAMDMDNCAFDTLKDIQRRWASIGFVHIKFKSSLQKEYKALTDQLYDKIRSNEGSRRMDNFRGRISQLRESGSSRGVSSERDKLVGKLNGLESEIATLENNIGFFGNSKNAESLINDVRQKIQKAKNEITEIIEKIRVIDNQ
ncbi:MAG: DUF349 domain-containing protein [Rikenellaceae bacterium]